MATKKKGDPSPGRPSLYVGPKRTVAIVFVQTRFTPLAEAQGVSANDDRVCELT